jgi:hypothetical protein
VTVLQVALQRLLLVAAALALLGHGGLEIAPRLVAAAAGSTASATSPAMARPAAARPAAESKPVAPASTLRTALAAPAPQTGDTAAGPRAALRVAPHLLAQPVVRPPTRPHVLGAGGGASGRAPPVPAGT